MRKPGLYASSILLSNDVQHSAEETDAHFIWDLMIVFTNVLSPNPCVHGGLWLPHLSSSRPWRATREAPWISHPGAPTSPTTISWCFAEDSSHCKMRGWLSSTGLNQLNSLNGFHDLNYQFIWNSSENCICAQEGCAEPWGRCSLHVFHFITW